MVQPHIDEDYIPGEASSLLGPGWKQVQEDDWVKYDNDEEYEDVEEELYVTMDLGNHLMPTVLMKAEECQLVGLDTPTPWIKIGNNVFRGNHDQLIGSEILFQTKRDPDDPTISTHLPFARTDKRISFRPMISRDQVNRTLEIDDEIELDQVGNLVEAALEADGGYEQDAVQNMTPEQFKAWAPYGLTKAGKPKKRPGPPITRIPTLPRRSFPSMPGPSNTTDTIPAEPLLSLTETGFEIPADGLPTRNMLPKAPFLAKRNPTDHSHLQAVAEARAKRREQRITKEIENQILGEIPRRRRKPVETPAMEIQGNPTPSPLLASDMALPAVEEEAERMDES